MRCSDEPTQGGPALAALLLADGRLPTGGHAASGGLEGALTAGLATRDVPAYLRLRLRTVARTDAAVAVLACRALTTGGADDASPTADDLAAAWAARTPVASVRAASDAQGRAILRLLRRTSPRGPAVRWLTECPRGLLARPLALGAFAGQLAASPDDVARAVGYDEVASLVAAALKLLPLDPADTVAWTLSCADDLAALVAACRRVHTPDDIPAPATPELDEWACDHADHPRRLFRV